jgi:hypothetical protein
MSFSLTPKAFRMLLPAKSARIASLLMRDKACSPLDALRAFYSSQTYHELEREASKCWWESPAQIYNDYLHEHQNPTKLLNF